MPEIPERPALPARSPADPRARVVALRSSAAVGPVSDAPDGRWVPDTGRRRTGRRRLLRPDSQRVHRAGDGDGFAIRAVTAGQHALGPITEPRPQTALDPEPEPPSDPALDPEPASESDPLAGSDSASAPARDLDVPAIDQLSRPAWATRLVRRGPWGALAERWVPEPLRGARVDPGRRGAVLLSIIAAVAALAAAVGVWWDRPEPRPITPVALAPVSTGAASPTGPTGPASTAPAGGRQDAAPSRGGTSTIAQVRARNPAGSAGSSVGISAAGPAASAPATGPILVSVTGRVHHPGLVRLPAGSRVADAIAAAGGSLDPADLTGLNLAARLSDGDSVVVAGPEGNSLDAASGTRSPAGDSSSPPGGTVAPIDLNTADAAALEGLPGVGPVTASAIIAWRTDHGPFTSIEQLQAVPGIGPAKYAQIAPHVTQ